MQKTPQVYKIRLKKGDKVIVLSGKHKGKTGKVLSTLPKENKVLVEGINVVKKHIKPSQIKPQGGIEEITKPIWVSKVAILDDQKKPSKIGYQLNKDGQKVRIFKTTGKEIK